MSFLKHTNNYTQTMAKTGERLSNSLAPTLTNMNSFGAYLEPLIQVFAPKWRHNTLNAEVLSINFESSNVYTITLKTCKKWPAFIAGQFINLTVEKNGSFYTRSFSISSSPSYFKNTGQIQLSIRTQDKGLITPWLANKLETGSTVYLSPALGDFTVNTNLNQKLFIAAGSGITPIKSILSEHKSALWFRHASLVFYVRSPEELIFANELKALEAYGLNVKIIFTQDQGRICADHLNQIVNEFSLKDISSLESYICGPAEMINASVSLLHDLNIPDEQIHFEYFGPAPLEHINMPKKDAYDDEIIQVDYLNSNKQVKLDAENLPKTLLDLAEQEGLNPTSGCRIGICHQCTCKKKQGRVFNTKTKQYSDTGEEEIQLCLSVPVGHVELEL